MVKTKMVTEGFIVGIANQASASIADPLLRNAFARAFERESVSVETVERCLTKATARKLPQETMRAFLRNWRDTHFTAKFTSAVAQVLRDGSILSDSPLARTELSAAADCAQMITDDDLGLRHGDNHGELFSRLAVGVTGDESWESSTLSTPAAVEFKSWAHEILLSAARSPKALVCMAAFELFHRGECTLAADRFSHLLNVLGVDAADAAALVEYPRVHGVEADLHNMSFAMKGVRHFYSSRGMEVDYQQVEEITVDFFSRLGTVFTGLELMIDSSPDASIH